MANATYRFVQVKAFGDLTIAAAALRRVPGHERERFGLVISPHLGELAAVLAPGCRVEILPLGERGKPAFFSPHDRHLLDRLRSAVSLRRALAGAAPGSTLVMPHLAWKNRFITGRRTAVALPAAGNIYTAYEDFVRGVVGEPSRVAPPPSPRLRRVAICPTSSSVYKNLPANLVRVVSDACAGAGLVAELLLLEGERHAHQDDIPTRVIPRRFAALGEALGSYAGVVSADSLPAHLAEYRGTPVFVISPRPNAYWLPPRAFGSGSWGIFTALDDLVVGLRRFLERDLGER